MKEAITIAICFLLAFAIWGCKDDERISSPHSSTSNSPIKEAVIDSLIHSYETRDITLYNELIHENYRWFFQENDTDYVNAVFWQREEDCRAVENIFKAANGTPDHGYPLIERFHFSMSDGIWNKVDSLENEACDDCWMTLRAYDLSAVIGETTYLGHASMEVYIVPVKSWPVRGYQILIARDIHGSLISNKFKSINEISWGRFKAMYK